MSRIFKSLNMNHFMKYVNRIQISATVQTKL